MKKRVFSKEKTFSNDAILTKELKNLNLSKQTGSVENLKNNEKSYVSDLKTVKQ